MCTEFEMEVLPYRDELLRSAMRLCRDADQAHDLVQETLLRALSSFDEFIRGTNCRAWLHRILKNCFINHYRRRKRHVRFTNESGDDAVSAVYGDFERAQDPVRDMVEQSMGDEVSRALDSLSQDYRQIVLLADLEEVRYRDIAVQLNIPIGTVMSRLFRARRQLEGRLRDYAVSDFGIARAV
jgi:RNA polymerase sigma-70 factor (ECF subfamily)